MSNLDTIFKVPLSGGGGGVLSFCRCFPRHKTQSAESIGEAAERDQHGQAWDGVQAYEFLLHKN